MEPSHETFDHTADIGFRVRAETLAGLVQPAGEALYAVIGELASEGAPETVRFELTGSDAPLLLRDYLAELLSLFEQHGRMATRVETAELRDGRLFATVSTLRVDFKRSDVHHEVKAITYHELDIQAIPGGYEATVIVDI